jgi:hypothetical protein
VRIITAFRNFYRLTSLTFKQLGKHASAIPLIGGVGGAIEVRLLPQVQSHCAAVLAARKGNF